MRKNFIVGCVLCVIFCLVACDTKEKEGFAVVEKQKDEEIEIQIDGVSSIEELNEFVLKDVEVCIAAINEKFGQLTAEIDTYDKYIQNKDLVEAFYTGVYQDTKNICIRMREYCLKYVEIILESDKTDDEKYDELEEMYDVVYDEAGDEIYDGYYDGVLDEIYDVFYDEILDEAYDEIEYGEWLDVRSEEYELWLDTRSDVYEEWLDFRSDSYEFWLDVRSEFWNKDIEKAKEKVQDFQEDINKLKEGQKENEGGEIRPEFKEAMDSYEAFYTEYCDFIKKYNANPTDDELILEYGDMTMELGEVTAEFEEWEETDLNTEELQYYIEDSNRVAQKLIEVSEN